MKLSANCGSADRWHLIRESGYDYAEGYFAGITLADEAEFQKSLEFQKNADVPVDVFNGFFTQKVTLLGEEKTSRDTIREYCEKGFFRAKTLGGRIAVIGSGKSRAIPEGVEKSRAEEEFLDTLYLIAEIAIKNDMKIAIEPLRYAETNFINTLEESISLCRLANHRAIGTIVDFFHFHSNGESLEVLKDSKDTLFHAHIARPNPDRRVPTEIDRETCQLWADALHKIGYNERITLEAIFAEDYESDLRAALPIMKLF